MHDENVLACILNTPRPRQRTCLHGYVMEDIMEQTCRHGFLSKSGKSVLVLPWWRWLISPAWYSTGRCFILRQQSIRVYTSPSVCMLTVVLEHVVKTSRNRRGPNLRPYRNRSPHDVTALSSESLVISTGVPSPRRLLLLGMVESACCRCRQHMTDRPVETCGTSELTLS